VQEEEEGGGQKAKWKLSAGHFSSSIDHGVADEVKKAPHTHNGQTTTMLEIDAGGRAKCRLHERMKKKEGMNGTRSNRRGRTRVRST